MRDEVYGWRWLLQLLLELFSFCLFSPHLSLNKNFQTAPTSITQGDSVNNQSEQSAAEQSPSEEGGEAVFRPQ
jgi:hypothetical protein